MGTKSNPGDFDCYAHALADEPMFVLLGRDPDFARLVRKWAKKRARDVECGERPIGDMLMVREAKELADHAEEWRRTHMGQWRR